MNECIPIPDVTKIKPILPRRMKVECFALLGFYPKRKGSKGTKNE